jgi:hypothetical protein
MALQAALSKAQPQGKPLTPRALYADGSDPGNSLQRPGTSSLRSAAGGRDGRSMSVRIAAPAPSVTRPPTGGAYDMRASGGSGATSPTLGTRHVKRAIVWPLNPPLPPSSLFASGALSSILGNAMMNRGPGAQEIVEYARCCFLQ